MTMTQHDAPSTRQAHGSAPDSEQSRRRWPMVGLIAVLVAMVGLGVWFLVDGDDDADAQLPDDVDQVLEDYLESWNTYDADLFLATTGDGYYLHTERYGDWDRDRQVQTVGDAVTHDWHSEVIGDAVVVGDGPWYVAARSRVTSDMHPEGGTVGISVFALARDDDGTPKVIRHIVQADFYEADYTTTSG